MAGTQAKAAEEPQAVKDARELFESPAVAPWVYPDLSIVADPVATDTRRVRFSVTLTPGLLQPTPPVKVAVEVLVMDVYGNVVLRTYPLSSAGESVSDSVTLPLHDSSVIKPGAWTRKYWLVVDPFKRIAERNEANNWSTASASIIT